MSAARADAGAASVGGSRWEPENIFGGDGVVVLAMALKRNTAITSVKPAGPRLVLGAVVMSWVPENDIGDRGAMAIAAALRSNTSITCVELSGERTAASAGFGWVHCVYVFMRFRWPPVVSLVQKPASVPRARRRLRRC